MPTAAETTTKQSNGNKAVGISGVNAMAPGISQFPNFPVPESEGGKKIKTTKRIPKDRIKSLLAKIFLSWGIVSSFSLNVAEIEMSRGAAGIA